jgi:hexosaminidase
MLMLMPVLSAVAQHSAHEAHLAISWGVVDNYVGGASYFESKMTVRNTGHATLGDDWAVYFNFIRRIHGDSLTGPLSIRFQNGSFYEMRPEPGFRLPPGDSVSVRIIASNWVIRKSAAPSGFYVVQADGVRATIDDVRIEPFLEGRQVDRHADDEWPVATAATRFETNQRVSLLPDGAYSPVIPTPVEMRIGSDVVRLETPIQIRADESLSNEAHYLSATLKAWFGLESNVESESVVGPGISISLSTAELPTSTCGPGESYQLDIDNRGIRITGSDPAGVFYGVQSLLALVDPAAIGSVNSSVDVPHTVINDCPRFAYRGLMIDVGRYFHPPDRIEKAMRFMSFYKMNRLHFHLTEDEGWRLPIGSLPELTEIGGRRGHTLDSKKHLPPAFGSGPDAATSAGSGHYSRKEFVALLRFASDHHIRVIPEIDAPGHMRAAVVSMAERYKRLSAEGREQEAREYLLTDLEDKSEYRSVQGWDDNVANVCLESTYRFYETIIDELVDLFKEADAPLEVIHLGGDEVPQGVWEKSPACHDLINSNDDLVDVRDLSAYFYRRVVAMLESRELLGAGWEEIGLGLRVNDTFERETPKADLAGKVLPFAWNSVWGWGGDERAYKLANAGYQVVLANAPNLYFDLAYEKHPDDPGFAWAGFVDTRKSFELTPLDIYNSAYTDLFGRTVAAETYQDSERLRLESVDNILGIQGQLWGENTPTNERFEYLLFPKLLGVAERAWVTRPEWSMIADMADRTRRLDKDWNRFANSLGRREFSRLAAAFGGVGYRIPPPGAVVAGGRLEANIAYPGLQLRYTTDGSTPRTESPVWVEPVVVDDSAVLDGKVVVRAFDRSGRGGRSVVVSSR